MWCRTAASISISVDAEVKARSADSMNFGGLWKFSLNYKMTAICLLEHLHLEIIYTF